MRKVTITVLAGTLLSIALCSGLLVSDVLAANFSFLGPSGGLGGKYFSGGQAAGRFSSDDRRLIEVRIRSGAFIDAIQTVYVNAIGQKIVSPMHGGAGGTLSVFKLGANEYITRISGKYGWYIDSLLIETNKGRAKGWGGTGGSANYTYTAPAGYRIHGFFGRSGKFLDAIGIILKTK